MTSSSLTPKVIGKCSGCDERLFFHDENRWVAPAFRIQVVCISGAHMGFTVCGKCLDEPDLKRMYSRMLLAHALERANWKAAKADPFDERQMELQTKMSCGLANDVPIGVLYTLSLEEILHG